MLVILNPPPSPAREIFKKRKRRKVEHKSLVPERLLPTVSSAQGKLLNLLRKFSNTEEQNDETYDSMVYETSKDGVQEELAWSNDKLVWSRGSAVYKIFTFASDGERNQIIQALFTTFEVSEPDRSY